MSLTLVVMAAGMGSRYGGLKQMDPVGPSGEFIIDYSIHDALLAGFDRVVFIIRRDIEKDFRATIGARAEKRVKTEYVFQSLDFMPRGYQVPPERKKPWGTGHAVFVCGDAVNEPFGVINADDFYGAQSYDVLAGFLRDTAGDSSRYGAVGFILRNTLSEYGCVSRGICRADAKGNLESIIECTKIEHAGGGLSCNTPGLQLSGNEPVSMNMWGFKPSIFTFLGNKFQDFLNTSAGDPKAEYFISEAVNMLVAERKVTCQLLGTKSAWFGITNPEDKQDVVGKIRRLVDAGVYPGNILSLH